MGQDVDHRQLRFGVPCPKCFIQNTLLYTLLQRFGRMFLGSMLLLCGTHTLLSSLQVKVKLELKRETPKSPRSNQGTLIFREPSVSTSHRNLKCMFKRELEGCSTKGTPPMAMMRSHSKTHLGTILMNYGSVKQPPAM